MLPRDEDAVSDLSTNVELLLEYKEFGDETLRWLKEDRLPLHEKNKYLKLLLEWEHAPVKPIKLVLPNGLELVDYKTASDEDVSKALRDLVVELEKNRFYIFGTEHIPDRPLYALLVAGVLECKLKNINAPETFWCFWNFDSKGRRVRNCNLIRLTYYASDLKRRTWALEQTYRRDLTLEDALKRLPPKRKPPYKRDYITTRIPPEFL